MSHYDYVGGGAVEATWVPTRLMKGDMLSTLASMYRLSAKQIVNGNGVTFSSEAIEGDRGWIEKAGSKTRIEGKVSTALPLGHRWVFDDNTVILLPPGGPRPPAQKAPASPDAPSIPLRPGVKEAGLPIFAIAIGVGALILLAGSGKKSSRSSSSSAKITRFRA